MLKLGYWGKCKDVWVIKVVVVKTIQTQRTGKCPWLKNLVNFIAVYREMVQA